MIQFKKQKIKTEDSIQKTQFTETLGLKSTREAAKSVFSSILRVSLFLASYLWSAFDLPFKPLTSNWRSRIKHLMRRRRYLSHDFMQELNTEWGSRDEQTITNSDSDPLMRCRIRSGNTWRPLLAANAPCRRLRSKDSKQQKQTPPNNVRYR